ncbi:PPR domain-containing protein/PPR_1 domain-containing protein/PPR_2 domain-containing protein/PPR_3 domain-containing protein [Cephalotus follicularis]|uniref:PPR domain-containing protein/PPR_1 domain-containing protein/PPR_2 domain-containing protein/PPR_3 domain-containing protein n=1 Tax=Cephalotus follicularis TaxID=3775 RepID=A0A1Q3B7N2_CEPFO|nr:PPR domain-containing protein/PPR_1 domain-containing protein/PPR_2 domain-containing protein/PPR_3 domain-containing protein [Cephalotus follicularis]
MVSLKHANKTRALVSQILIFNNNINILSVTCLTNPRFYSITQAVQQIEDDNNNTTNTDIRAKDVVLSFKEWFKTRNDVIFDRIFDILRSQDEDDHGSRESSDLQLSQMGLRLTESLVLDVLAYGKNKDVLSCLKFFDWAGRQRHFHHTRATFHAIFKILSKAKLMSLTIDFLENYMKHSYVHRVRFYDTLVMGYAVSGKPDIALQLFGRMRFQGLDLYDFTYHVLLNALVEESCFDAVEVIAKQISMRGFENDVTRSILVKSMCKQGQLDEAEGYLRRLASDGMVLSEQMVSVLVGALCKSNRFEQVGRLLEHFRELGIVSMEHPYGVWLRELVRDGKLDVALEFLKSKKSLEGYVPDVSRYNVFLCRLLKENRLREACDLLMEMKEEEICPDTVTMNATLCFFCKVGMVEVALELYNSRLEFGLSPNGLVGKYLINTLCRKGGSDEAYHVLKTCIAQGFVPGRKTFSFLANTLCRERKLDKMKELVSVAVMHKFIPSGNTFDNFISALCRARKVEDGYLIYGELKRINKATQKNTYYSLIDGFTQSNRGDIAARLLIEMQEKGLTPTRNLFKAVIRCLCHMENAENQFDKLLQMQLSRHEPSCQIYNFFLYGAGHSKKPELARKVYEIMWRDGTEPNLSSDILMLQSYMKNEKFSEALNFFADLRSRRKIGRKLYNTMVVGLCKANRPDIAIEFLKEMRINGIFPSMECYEVLIQQLCLTGEYEIVINLINDLGKVGRHVTTFIGNVLLLHSLKTKELYETWIQLRDAHNETSTVSLLRQLIGVFAGCIGVNQHLDDWEEMIGRCFPLDLYTYNMLLRKLSISDINHACEFFNRICLKGFEPNRWTYDILVQGLSNHGRTAQAKRLVEEMFQKGLDPTQRTKLLI